MTLRRKKLSAFLDREQEGARGDRETEDEEKARKYGANKSGARTLDTKTTHLARNPQSHAKTGHGRNEVRG